MTPSPNKSSAGGAKRRDVEYLESIEFVKGYVCPFCGRAMFKKTKIPKQLNLIWYCSGCEKRANNCQCEKVQP